MEKTESLQIFKNLVTNENVDEMMRSQEFPLEIPDYGAIAP